MLRWKKALAIKKASNSWFDIYMFSIRNIIIKLKIMFVASQIFCNVLRSAAQIVTTQHRFYFIYFQIKRGFLIKKSYWFILKFASIEKNSVMKSMQLMQVTSILYTQNPGKSRCKLPFKRKQVNKRMNLLFHSW